MHSVLRTEEDLLLTEEHHHVGGDGVDSLQGSHRAEGPAAPAAALIPPDTSSARRIAWHARAKPDTWFLIMLTHDVSPQV